MSENQKDSLISNKKLEIDKLNQKINNRDSVVDVLDNLNLVQAEIISDQNTRLIKKRSRLPFLIGGSFLGGVITTILTINYIQ